MNKKRSEKTEIEQKAEKIKKLVIEEERCAQQIRELERNLSELRDKKRQIKDQINRILNLGDGTESDAIAPTQKYAIPKSGLVVEIADVMSQTDPMTKDEIAELLEKRGISVNDNSLRSNLSNLPCFENIKKSNPNYNGKKGWICHKSMLRSE